MNILKYMRKITECPASCSWKSPIWAKKGMEMTTGDDIAETEDSVHQSDKEVSQVLDAKVTKILTQAIQQSYA